MRDISPASPAVVVGIDGSRGAVNAALWAIDEAVERDLPLRLVYAIKPRPADAADQQSIARDFATAEVAVRYAAMAIESVDRPVKIEVEIVQERPATALVAASQSAAMVCLGAMGIDRATGKRVGSTVAGLLDRVHCPVAIVRQSDPPKAGPGWVVTELDGSRDAATVLGDAVAEARLRKAPLRVLTTWRPRFTDIHDHDGCAQSNRHAKAKVERFLTGYRARYPDLDVQAVAVRGNPLNYLAQHAQSIGLLVLGYRPSVELSEFIGPAPQATVQGLTCSVLISARHGAL